MGADAASRDFREGFRVPPRMAGLWLVGIALYLAAITYIGWADVAEAVQSIAPRWILLGTAVECAALWIRASKWRMALGPDRQAVTQFFLSKAAGSFTPGRIGELSPLLLKRFREPRTGAWIVLDRLMEAAGTLLFGFAGAIFLVGVSRRNALLAWIVLVAAAVALTFVVMMREDFPRRVRIVLRPEKRTGIAGRVLGFVCDGAEEVRVLGPRTPLLGLVSLITTAMDITVAFCLYASFAEQVPFLTLGAAQCAHAIVSVIPISSNVTGIPYAVSAGILHEAAGVPLDTLAAAIAVRFLMAGVVFWMSFAAGTRGLFQRQRFRDQGALFDYLATGESLYNYSPEALRAVTQAVGDAGRALDIGCGDGTITAAIQGDVIGLDISPRCVRGAARRGIRAVVANADGSLPFRDQQFDTVTCVDVAHHLDRQWERLLGELGRVLKDGGRLVLIEPDARNPFVRWTQAPRSPIRVAPWPNEPAIYPSELAAPLGAAGYSVRIESLMLNGEQTIRDVFPLWQRIAKAPFVVALSALYRGRANKFLIVAEKPAAE